VQPSGGDGGGGGGVQGLPINFEEGDVKGASKSDKSGKPTTRKPKASVVYRAAALNLPPNIVISWGRNPSNPPGNGSCSGSPCPHNAPGGGGTDPGTDASNDPAGENVTTPDYSSRTCDERVCSVGVTLPDARVEITAIDDNMPAPTGHYSAANLASSNHPVLFAARDSGGAKPACPGYQDTFTSWVQFGFKRPERGADYRKIAEFTLSHPLSHGAAAAAARKLQICFEAPYLFAPRPGYGIALHGTAYDGVLPECGSVHARPGMQTPCVATRKVIPSGNGWVVKITFRIPANKEDPKALG
jgi:hypothetical protein